MGGIPTGLGGKTWSIGHDSIDTRKGLIDTVFFGGLGNQVKGLPSAALGEAKSDLTDQGLKKKKPPAADPAAERAAADAAATTQANARIAFQRRAMRENSLLTGGGQTAAVGTGRSTLGV